MKQSPSAYLAEFHQTFDLPRSAVPRDLAAVAHELADVVYVAYGTALTYCIDLDAVIAEVHRANMSKLGRAGRPLMLNGKVQKGPDYRPPHIAALFNPPAA